MKTVKEKRSKSNVKDRVAAYTELVGGDCGFDSRLLLIQQLIPIGLMAVEEALQEEVSRMVGERHSREGSLKRCGSNPGRCFCAIKNFPFRCLVSGIPRIATDSPASSSIRSSRGCKRPDSMASCR